MHSCAVDAEPTEAAGGTLRDGEGSMESRPSEPSAHAASSAGRSRSKGKSAAPKSGKSVGGGNTWRKYYTRKPPSWRGTESFLPVDVWTGTRASSPVPPGAGVWAVPALSPRNSTFVVFEPAAVG